MGDGVVTTLIVALSALAFAFTAGLLIGRLAASLTAWGES